MARLEDISLELTSVTLKASLRREDDDRAVIVVGAGDVELEPWVEALPLTVVLPQLGEHVGGSRFADWRDRDVLRLLDECADQLCATEGFAADSIGLVAIGEAAPIAWLGGCTSTRFCAVASLGAPPVYAALSSAKPMQPVEMTLNLDRALLAGFPVEAEHLGLVRDQLDAGSKDYEWVGLDAEASGALARFLEERL